MRNHLDTIGLILNFIGSILMAFSIEIINPCEELGACISYSGVVQTMPSINIGYFNGGISILILGFLLQLISKIPKIKLNFKS